MGASSTRGQGIALGNAPSIPGSLTVVGLWSFPTFPNCILALQNGIENQVRSDFDGFGLFLDFLTEFLRLACRSGLEHQPSHDDKWTLHLGQNKMTRLSRLYDYPISSYPYSCLIILVIGKMALYNPKIFDTRVLFLICMCIYIYIYLKPLTQGGHRGFEEFDFSKGVLGIFGHLKLETAS